MTQQEGSSTKASRSDRGRSSKVVWVAAVLAVLAALLFGRGVFGQWARYMAIQDMNAWAIVDARRWLDLAQRVDPNHPETFLLRARCARFLGQSELQAEMLDQARKLGAAEQEVDYEVTLAQIQSGSLVERPESKLGELTQSGLSPHDIASAYITDRMIHQDLDRAYVLLQAWEADFPGEPHIHYVRGTLWLRNGDRSRALDEFNRTLAAQPRHELAQIALAQLYDETNETEKAFDIYRHLVSRDPENQNLRAGLARVLRKQGRIEQARAVLAPALSQDTTTSSALAAEAGELELELGNYESAEQWFEKVSAKDMVNHSTLSAAAVTLALLGRTVEAEKAFEWILDEVALVTAMHDLQMRMQINPEDNEATSEFQQLIQQLSGRSADENPLELASSSSSPIGSGISAGVLLYDRHCAACHGPEGRGDGRAAQYLYPRPRDLRTERMRLVSTSVGIPTTKDIVTVLRNGVPGTAMAPRDTLRDFELEQLAGVVRQMRREGVRQQYIASLLADGEEVDSDDVDQVVAIQTGPREIVTAPAIPAGDEASIKLGKELYKTQTCDSCHGASGTGDDKTPLFDDFGRPVFPGDLVHEYFKGGNTAESIYLRIRLGMPGSPHPASVGLTERQLIALVHYCQSLGQQPKLTLTNHQRAMRATSRPALPMSE